MKWVVVAIGALFFMSLAAMWIQKNATGTDNLAAAGAASIDLPSMPVTRPLGTALETDSGPVGIEGAAIMDMSTGEPAIPYIKYTDANGRFTTKQLIFADERGCLPGAGDIPCVPSYPARSAYPKLTTGQRIHVEGIIRENRLLVESLSVVE